MTKKKKDIKRPADVAPAKIMDDKTSTPAADESDDNSQGEEITTPPDDEPIQDLDPTVALMRMAFDAWVGKQLEGVFYYMTRTFTHHRRNEKYGSHLIFDALETINRGEHGKLLEEIQAFHETLLSELDEYVAVRNAKR